MHSDFDVIVVGAGPAGSVAALRLARAGVRVRIVDRAVFPRDKLCGDTLNPGSMALLSRLHPALAHRVRERAVRTTGITVTGPGAVTVAADYPAGMSGAAVSRRELDQWLLDAALEAGATFEPAVAVQAPVMDDTQEGRVVGVRARCQQREYVQRARVVIAADGRASRLAAALKLSRFTRTPRRWACGAYFSDVAGMTAHGEMHIRGDGYIGVAPLPDALVNVCVVRARPNLVAGQALDRLIATALERDPALHDRFARARRVSPVVALGPLAVESQAPGCPGMLLAGDAAGFVDPMTGDGLRFAIRGGELAATAALAELESGAPAHQRLEAWRSREFNRKWRLNRALRALVGSPRALSCAALASRAWSAPVERLVGVAGDVALARRPA